MAEGKNTEGKKNLDGQKKAINSYAYYSGLGFQMIAVIGVFAFIGYKIDEGQNTSSPLYTAFFSLGGVFISLYLVIRSVKKDKS